MIDGAVVVMRWRPEVMMAQALRLPDLRPISVRMVKHDVFHALKKQIRSQGSISIVMGWLQTANSIRGE